jgi:hypothetical protein
MIFRSHHALLLVALTATASAQNDDCANAIPLSVGTVAFSTVNATTSAPAWPCANGGTDIWYTFAATSNADLRISTCGSSYDTALEVFTGTCGALTSVACNDDACGLQSEIIVSNVTTSSPYTIRVGGFAGASGSGTLQIMHLASSPADTVAHYTLDDTGPTCVDVAGIVINGTYMGGAQGAAGAAAGTRAAVDFTTPDYVIIPAHPALDQLTNDLSAAAWVNPNVMAPGVMRVFGNQGPGGSWSFGLTDAPGLRFTTHGVRDYDIAASIPVGQWTHVAVTMDVLNDVTFYVNGSPIGTVAGTAPANAPNPNYVIGALDPGGAIAEHFEGRIDDVQAYHGVLTPAQVVQIYTNPGTNLGGNNNPVCCGFCSSNPNSTGMVASTFAVGTGSLSENNYQLTISQMPPNAFAFFLVSLTPGLVSMPAGSMGNLCLSGNIGRYVGPGEIRNTGATGRIVLRPDFTRIPSPLGFVSANPGESWHFQAWFRDSVGGVATSNFSNGRLVGVF